MQYSFILIAIVTFLTQANAQEIGVKAGVAIPTGNYSNTTTNNSSNGFAGTGTNLAIRLHYPIIKNTGLLFETGFTNQSLKEDALNQAYSEQNTAATISLSEVNGYHSTYSLLGGYMQFPLRRIKIKAEIAIGFIYLNTPSYTVSYAYNSNTNADYYSSHSASSLLYSWGVNAGYSFKSGITFLLFVHNMNATLDIPAGTYSSSSQTFKDLNFEVWQLGAGIGYSFLTD